MEKKLPVRKPLRLGYYDYNTPGAYFITFCTHNRKNMLSSIVGAIQESPLQGRSIMSKMVGYIKMNASKEIRRHYGDVAVWQRGYHDHVIRNREDYGMIAKYIHENPIRWTIDKLYSSE